MICDKNVKSPSHSCAMGFFASANKNRQRRGKEEKAALPVYENSQTFAAVRRWLVVCPPHWLLPRIRGGQCFLKYVYIVPDKNGVSL